MEPSKYQRDIFDWVSRGRGDAVVNATAGSGKTTTLVAASKLPGMRDVLFLAFNRAIVNELQSRLGGGVTCKTLNALGHSAIGFALGRNVRLTMKDDKYDALVENELRSAGIDDRDERFHVALGPVTKLLSLVMSHLTKPTDVEAVFALADHYGLDLPDLDAGLVCSVIAGALRTGEQMGRQGIISFDDQIYLPYRFNWRPKRAQFILVDEAQDLSPAKLELALAARAPGGRILFVGDENQSIFGFSGAGTDSIQQIIARTKATVLPLSICYRCPTSVIAAAQEIVPTIEAAPGAAAGEVVSVPERSVTDLAQTGDLILCRKNAPLVRLCVRFIRAKKPARVKGRDIGKSLVVLAQTALGKRRPFAQIEAALDEYLTRRASQLAQRKGGEARVADLTDRIDCVRAILDSFPCSSIDDLAAVADEIFGDGQSAIELSSVHKAKGLEADRVFIIEPASLPLRWKNQQPWEAAQEWNLRFVAITRAKQSLFIAGNFAELAPHAQPALLEEEQPATVPPDPAPRSDAAALQELAEDAHDAPDGAHVDYSDYDRQYAEEAPVTRSLSDVRATLLFGIEASRHDDSISDEQLVEIILAATRPDYVPQSPAPQRAALPAEKPSQPALLGAAEPTKAERFSCTCYACKAAWVSEHRDRICRSCGSRAVRVLTIEGKHSDAPCTATCQTATGSDCTCSCQGLRHGERWLTGFRAHETETAGVA